MYWHQFALSRRSRKYELNCQRTFTLRNHLHCTQCSKHGRNSLLWVWLIGVVKTKATIVALLATAVRFLAKPSLFFAVFDSLIAITARESA